MNFFRATPVLHRLITYRRRFGLRENEPLHDGGIPSAFAASTARQELRFWVSLPALKAESPCSGARLLSIAEYREPCCDSSLSTNHAPRARGPTGNRFAERVLALDAHTGRGNHSDA